MNDEKMIQPTIAWAIITPDGKIDPTCIRASRQDCIDSTHGNWKWATENGFRCIKIKVGVYNEK